MDKNEKIIQELRTELQKANKRLQLMETILDHLPATVYVKDRQSRHIYVNKQDLEIKGTSSREDVIGKTDQEFFENDQASELMADEQRIIETGQPLLDKEEKFIDKKNGNIRWLLTSKIPWPGEEGEPQGIVGIGQEITWRKQELDILNEVNRRLFEADSVSAIMELIVAGAMRLSNTTSGIIFMVEGEQGKYLITESYSFPAEYQHPDPRIKSGKGITYEVIVSGKPVCIPETRIDERTHPQLQQENIRALLAVPLKWGERVIGVFYVNDNEPHHFSSNEISQLSTLADYAVVAIENARLIQEKDVAQRQIIALHEASSALIASSDSETVFETMAKIALRATGADWVNIILIDDHQGVYRLVNYPENNHFTKEMLRPRPTGNSLTIFDTGEIYIYADVDADPGRVNPVTIQQGFKSLIGLPLTVENNQRIGVMWLHYRRKQRFSPMQVKSLELFARQGAITYNNALRLNKIERMGQITREQINTIGQMAESIAAYAKGLHEMLQSILAWIGVLTTEDGEPPCLVEVLTPNGQAGNLIQLEGWLKDDFGQLDPSAIVISGVFEKVIQNEGIELIGDVLSDPLARPRHPMTRSQLVIPIIQDGRLFGLLNIEHPRLDALNNLIEAANTIAHMVLIAIENARQYEEIKKARQIIGGRTALAWMNLASATWYHDVRREAATIRNWITLAKDDMNRGSRENLIDHFNHMNASLQRILDKKEIIPHSLASDVSLMAIYPILKEQFARIAQEKAGTGVRFSQPAIQIEDTVIVKVSPEWLEKALDILVNNAIEATVGCSTREINFKVYPVKDNLIINVTDTGKGLPPEIKEALSAQVPPAYNPIKKGLGMGLLLAQAIVETFGGNLDVGETSTTGTTMQIYIPIDTQRGRKSTSIQVTKVTQEITDPVEDEGKS